MALRFTFICDANDRVGLGHFSRCYSIALGLRGLDRVVPISFCGDLSSFAAARLSAAGFGMLDRLTKESAATSLVVHDSYEVDQTAIDALIEISGRFVKIDDFNQFDLRKAAGVINFRIGAESEKYDCPNAFLGLSYFPAHPSLQAVRQANIDRRRDWIAEPVYTVLLFIGGVDRFSVAPMVLRHLDRVVRGKRFVLLQRADAGLGDIPIVNNHFLVEPFTDRVAEHFAAADAAITGGGLMKYDAGFSCVPNACISQTPEQQADTGIAAAHGLTFDLGEARAHTANSAGFEAALTEFLSPKELARQRTRMTACYESGSPQRLAAALLDIGI